MTRPAPWAISRQFDQERSRGGAIAVADWYANRPHLRDRDPEAWALLSTRERTGYDTFRARKAIQASRTMCEPHGILNPCFVCASKGMRTQ